MITKGDLITIEITDMTEGGAGVGRVPQSEKDERVAQSEEDERVAQSGRQLMDEEAGRGLAVFVQGAVPGDIVSCAVTKVKKNYIIASLREVINYSEKRRETACPYIDKCGGCALGLLNYDAQIELKVNQLKNKLIRIGGVENPTINPVITYEPYAAKASNHSSKVKSPGEFDLQEGLAFGYRNKAVIAVGEGDDGKLAIGFREAKSHRVVNCETCKIQMPTAMALADALRRFMSEYGVRAFNPVTGKGIIKSLMVRTAHATKEVMAVITINGNKLPHGEELAYIFDESINELEGDYSLESIIVSSQANEQRGKGANRKTGAQVQEYKNHVLAGKERIRDVLMGLEFDISAESFYQVNSTQTVKLYEEALRMLDAKEGERIIDAYCGIGTIGLIAASRTKANFLGIESVPQAVRDANKNAIRNGIVNALFMEGRAEDVIMDTISQRPDAVILDPPRAGCAAELIEAISVLSPKRIVYVSCDQGTLARDIKLFKEKGYELKETTPCDMFPETGALESVSLLVKRA